MQQVRIPKWLETVLRIPGAGIILALILLPLTLVSAGGGRARRPPPSGLPPQRYCRPCCPQHPACPFRCFPYLLPLP